MACVKLIAGTEGIKSHSNILYQNGCEAWWKSAKRDSLTFPRLVVCKDSLDLSQNRRAGGTGWGVPLVRILLVIPVLAGRYSQTTRSQEEVPDEDPCTYRRSPLRFTA
ncbi:hypothetical protein [Novipirellula artificiosorum]|uniref:Uncharacterized protein n=1 Tax=Novipirellula artificiosorum TaxID=2528016 RepID=A0A5C6DM60_9BACT|nr:hypothetical protein [Novipirellula artificiosorum]TWU37224.1 hypothetical protein Poly41_33520 [Novipirellula artificiosorum]